MTRRPRRPANPEIRDLRRHLLNVGGVKASPFRGVVYHGTDVAFDRFDPERIGTKTDEGMLGRGFYFSTDPAVARTSPLRVTARVALHRPLHVAFRWGRSKRQLVERALGVTHLTATQLSEALEDAGYDGVVLDYGPIEYQHQEIMVLDPRAIEILSVDSQSPARHANAAPAAWMYHGTTADRLPSIQRDGLSPSTDPRWTFMDEELAKTYVQHSMGRVFFAEHPKSAVGFVFSVVAGEAFDAMYGNGWGTCQPVLLRVPGHCCAFIEDVTMKSGFFVEQAVAPEHIEILEESGWTPLLDAKLPVPRCAHWEPREHLFVNDEGVPLDVPRWHGWTTAEAVARILAYPTFEAMRSQRLDRPRTWA